MQVRANGVTLHKCPRMYCSESSAEDHAIVAHNEEWDRIVLPFFLRGATSVLETESVTMEEFDRHECSRIELTAADLDRQLCV